MKIKKVIALFLVLVSLTASPLWGQLRVFTIGDSTVQDYTEGYSPRKGWGQMLQYFFTTSGVTVINKAVGGTSSMSFYNNNWPGVRDQLKTGDYVFIQFGINDRNSADPLRYAPAQTTFKTYIRKFVADIKAKGGIPVLVTTVRRNSWTNGLPYDAYHDHPIAMRELATELNLQLVDLDKRCYELFSAQGQLYTTRHIIMNLVAGEYPNYKNGNTDDVHYQQTGATDMARYVCDAIKNSTFTNIKKLIPFLKPQYTVTVNINDKAKAQTVTRTITYPQGIPVTLKTIPATGAKFLRWNNEAGAQVSTSAIYSFTMGNVATSYTAVYESTIVAPPVVSISAPVNNVSYTAPATIAISANASSAGGTITKVDFYNGTTLISSDATAPYTATITGIAAGSYSITAKATDNKGAITTSSAVAVKVNTASVNSTITIQENETGFYSFDGTIDNNNAGFTGTGFTNSNNAINAGITWQICVPTTGVYTLIWKYADGKTINRTAKLLIDGITVNANVSFPVTANWTTWTNTVATNVTLTSGTRLIRLQANLVDGLANIDYISITGLSPMAGTCGTLKSDVTDESIISEESIVPIENIATVTQNFVATVTPNPASSTATITISEGKIRNITIAQINGIFLFVPVTVISDNASVLNLNGLANGIYVINVTTTDNKSSTVQLIKK